MNMPVEASPNQSASSDARRADSAEAAQRDLLEFLATSDATAPPLAAHGAPPVQFAPLPDFVPPDFTQAGDLAPSVSPDRRSLPDESDLAKPEMYPHSIPTHRDADTEACERAARSAAQAVDEATKENLRRLEATMSWLQNEVRHLPRAPQIAPVRGVPSVQVQPLLPATSAFDAIIDRSSLRRTVHGTTVQSSAPLPIWLRENEAPIRLPPPQGNRGGLWRRLAKFFWACAVAAPIAYVFAITTSPLHKHIADIAGLTSVISSLLPMPHAQQAQSGAREPIAIAPVAGPAPIVTAQAAPVRVASAAGGETAPPGAELASAPEAAHAPPDQPVIATTVGDEIPPKEAPAPDAGAPATSAAPQDVSALVTQGNEFFEIGDLVAARILFRRAATAGDAAAAVAMGATYDPVVLTDRGVRGVAADLDKARAWYERAKDMGSSEGPRRLEMLANR
jgi:hypothetical protein